MELEKLLVSAGLTKNESEIYLAIVELGECTSGEIMKRAGTRTGRIYDILNSLIDKGLVSFVTRNNVKRFLAAEPTRILDYMERREAEHKKIQSELEESMPNLVARKHMAEKVPRVEVYEGVAGFKTSITVALDSVKKGDEIQVMGTAEHIYDIKPLERFLLQYHRKRIRRGVSARFLYRQEAAKTAGVRKKWKLSRVKILPRELRDPAYVYVCGDYVFTGLIGEQLITILIKSPEISRGYRTYFDFVWERSKPPKGAKK